MEQRLVALEIILFNPQSKEIILLDIFSLPHLI
jgi:hypothetical protein